MPAALQAAAKWFLTLNCCVSADCSGKVQQVTQGSCPLILHPTLPRYACIMMHWLGFQAGSLGHLLYTVVPKMKLCWLQVINLALKLQRHYHHTMISTLRGSRADC